MWETTNMSGKNPTVCDVLGVPPHTWGFLIVNIQHVEYLRFAIRAPPTFFRADSATLNTPHTTWKSDKMIFRTTKIIGTLPKIVGRGEISPKSARLSCGVYPALSIVCFWQMQTLASKLLSVYQTLSKHLIIFLRSCLSCCRETHGGFVQIFMFRDFWCQSNHICCVWPCWCVCVFVLAGFVSKLDEFICWLRDALETTDNWTPPRADINSLKLYLETHLVSKRLSIDILQCVKTHRS